jgi:radical SAM protein with 4Fe4S-binding SPASM domain
MKEKLALCLRSDKGFVKRALSLFGDHTFPQIWNTARFTTSKLRGFNSTYLNYDPLRLDLFITSRCNLNCRMCPYHSPDRLSSLLEFDDMQMDVFEWIVNRFSRALWLELGGGEPFLHSYIFEMIDYAHEHKMKVRIATNGTVLHDMLDRVVRSPSWLLNISLNACNSHEFYRLHGGSEQTYDMLLEDIPKLVDKRNRYNKRLKITISYICTKANYKSIPNMVELAGDLEVDEVRFVNLIPYGIPGFLQDQCLYDDDVEVMGVIKSVLSPRSNLKVVMPRLYKREHVDKRCNSPFFILSIDANGNISPCCQIAPQKSYGNVFTDKDVWNNSTFRKTREIFTNQSSPLPDFCKTCHGMVAQWRPAYISHRRGVR